MNLKDIGEFELIRRYIPFFGKNLPKGVEGIGNDCAVIPLNETSSWLVTTDLLIENTHFIRHQISAIDVGFKSLSVNLSDIAAMGGKPRFAFLSVGIPVETPIHWIDEFVKGFSLLAEKSNVLLLGGDTTRSTFFAINVLIIGEIENRYIKRRSEAKPGDIICCTGFLGDSGGGLKILQNNLPHDGAAKSLIDAHFRPHPELEEGIWLSKQIGINAMMDISDGIDSDIRRIMEESHCGAQLEVDKIPLSKHLQLASAQYNWDAKEIALSGGEDYSLLITVDPASIDNLKSSFFTQFHRPLYEIGRIQPGTELLYTLHHQRYHPKSSGFDHFKSP